MTANKKVLILSYYWPPSGGSGVQRWMYFAKHLRQLGWEPFVITVDEHQAAYPVMDYSLLEEVEGICVIKTATKEPLRFYSLLTSGNTKSGIPQGEIKRKSFLGKVAAFIRGNYFIPDARKGWVPFAVKAAQKVIREENINQIITTGPPHSTHLAGLQLKEQFNLNWWVDFRDPWVDIFYNPSFYRTEKAKQKDSFFEREVLHSANGVILTVGGELEAQLQKKAPNQNFVVLPNGYDAELMKTIPLAQPKDVFHVVYTGLLTHNQNYTSVFKALAELSTTESVLLSLAGNISQEIIDEIKGCAPEVEVVYHGYLSHKEAVGLMRKAHLLLNFIFKGASSQMISGKLLEYLATGIPVLSMGDPRSVAGEFISQGSAAVMLDAKDTKEISAFISKLALEKGRVFNRFPALEQWSREGLTRQLIETLSP
ncbi:glycosyltransferase family 4 protein [Flavobacteriaceae bacterium]|nr:glycosyltransferase family 4 protein [Flavobacteriaceae bacterium]